MEGESTRRIINVRVTNKNKVEYSDACSGKVYTFEPGKTTSIPLEAAKHIFSYDVKGSDEQVMFQHVCKRWGWNTPENVKAHFADIKEIWANFEFTPVAVKMVEQAVIDTSALAEMEDEGEDHGDNEQASAVPDLKLGNKKAGGKSAAA